MMSLDCIPVKKDGIICEGDFIYTKNLKLRVLILLLFGDENPFKNNLLDVKKLSVLVTYVTTEFYFFRKQTLGF